MRNSIRNRLTWAFIGLAIGPLLLLAIILNVQIVNTQRTQALNFQAEVARRVSIEVDAFFTQAEDQLYLVGSTQRSSKLGQEGQLNALTQLFAYQDAFETLVMLDAQGQEQVYLSRTSALSPALGDRSAAAEFTVPQTTGEAYYSAVRFDETTRDPLVTLAVPLLDIRSGQTEAVLVADVRLRKIWDLIARLRLNPGESVYIIDAQNRVVAHRNPSVVLRNVIFTPATQSGIQPGLASVDPASALDVHRGFSVRALVARFTDPDAVLATDTVERGNQKFTIVAEQTVAEALSLAINTAAILVGLALLALLLSVTLGLRTVRNIVQPIQTMATTAQVISGGDLSQQVQVERQDELGVLAKAFNSMTMQLQALIGGLEQRVAERTNELEVRSRYLQASAEVGQAASMTLETDQLIQQTVELVRERFELYYVGLFLVDERSEWAVLRAGTGEAGQKMLARGHRLLIGGGSMIGWCIANAQPRIAQVAEQDAVRLATAELPDTRSEAALPLRTRGTVIGALTVQSDRSGVFDAAALAVLQIMADQVANAIENARLFAESQTALETARQAYGELSRQGWRAMLQANRELGFRFDRSVVTPVKGEWRPDMLEAAQAGQSVIRNDATQPTLAFPLKVRDQIVGVLDLQRDTADHPWTDADQVLVETLTEQLALALESARLYEDTQRRAARERTIGQVAGRIRETLDMEAMLRIAAEQICQTLGLEDLVVRLVAPESVDVDTEGTQE